MNDFWSIHSVGSRTKGNMFYKILPRSKSIYMNFWGGSWVQNRDRSNDSEWIYIEKKDSILLSRILCFYIPCLSSPIPSEEASQKVIPRYLGLGWRYGPDSFYLFLLSIEFYIIKYFESNPSEIKFTSSPYVKSIESFGRKPLQIHIAY